MEQYYLILIVVLFALAISDLIVGVSNDAVNFLNSAIGSKAAPKWVIFLVASLGVLIGATFSSGMMEVARKGIFHPDMFNFSEIMIIFMAVMITDVILLDTFNTLGLPTSTTVSIVFELLGSAVAVSIVKISRTGASMAELSQYINSDKALAIISGILLSVIVAFTVGSIIQWISRVIFTFNYKSKLKYFGAIFGGLALTAITYFILIKGIKGSTWASHQLASGILLKDWVSANSFNIMLLSFITWSIVLQICNWIFKLDILKLIVIVGTFALAMAFAGNDLVNFIGVPLAGFSSYNAWDGSGIAPELFNMTILKGKVTTPTYMLLIAGAVMIFTLITSKKARSVVATSLDLSSQDETEERFDSSNFSRIIVRHTVKMNKFFIRLAGPRIISSLERRFEPTKEKEKDIVFDKIRAAVNLVVASILISIGTSLKLPLSTTYVTFMVAMGTSFADRAWGRDSAVYRISGVFTVIGGWFMTAFIAFTISAIIGFLIFIGGKFLVFVFIATTIFVIYRTHLIHKNRVASDTETDEELTEEPFYLTDKVLNKSYKHVINGLISVSKCYLQGIENFLNEDRKGVKETLQQVTKFNEKSKKIKNNLTKMVEKLQHDLVETGHFYVQVTNYHREMAHSLNFIISPIFDHINNNHRPFIPEQAEEMRDLSNRIDDFFNHCIHLVKEAQFDKIPEIIGEEQAIIAWIRELEKAQIKRIKATKVNTRNSMLYFNTLKETKNMLLNSINMLKAQRDFITHTETSTGKI